MYCTAFSFIIKEETFYDKISLLQMTSVERVVEYAELASEAPEETDRQPPRDWPNTGSIIFDRVNFSYSGSEPLVLKNLSVVITSGEKVLVFNPTCACLLVCTLHDWDWYAASVEGVVRFFFLCGIIFKSIIKGDTILCCWILRTIPFVIHGIHIM